MSLLEIKELTIRFGGLTAVSEVDLRVESGQVVALIGPNGAGKTTVFNAITGIYEPTSGQIRFAGRELERPFHRKLLLAWAAMGLMVGLIALLFAADIDRMWLATVKANFRGRQAEFPVGRAWRDFVDYLGGQPRIEQRAGRFVVLSNDGTQMFDVAPSFDEAERKRTEVAQRPEVRAAMAKTKRTRATVFVLATLLGMAACVAVWRQTRRAPAWVASQGLARTFQNIRLFQEMTVLENVLVGMHQHLASGARWRASERMGKFALPVALALSFATASLALRMDWSWAGGALACAAAGAVGYVGRMAWLGAFSVADLQLEAKAQEDARGLLAFVDLEGRAGELAKNLAYGEQRRLEIARALATQPALLLLDEPAAGMNPSETIALMKTIQAIRERGVTVLLIEHHMRVVMGISDRITVLEYGRKIAEGSPKEVQANPAVVEAYLGKEAVD